ncbi:MULTISPECIES: AAA family ATPase [Myxococcaceae]|uniref:AAA family ATPase n=1 Tax=Myxococcaceae TaxID=31 RepID=UPI00188DFF75
MSSSGEGAAPRWRLELLGGAALQGVAAGGAEAVRLPLDLRPAALLALLTLEGPQPRARLASLLWPASPETTARNNLRQLLRRLRQAAGEELVEDVEGRLRLSPQVAVDAAELELHATAGRYADVARQEGELLWGLDYDALPELGDWVHAQREHLRGVRAGALEQEAARLERAGALHPALEWNARLLELAPAQEAAHRRSMRLHAALGDRAAALRAFDRCRLALQRELDLEPSEETRALARDIERGRAGRSDPGAPAAAPAAPRAALLPTAILRPPVLAGRARVWAQLNAAWEARQSVFLYGEPGSGKTRLLTEFLASRGEDTLLVPGRPGDALVPYSTSVRLWRKLLARRPGAALPSWARRELAQLVPELSEEVPSRGGETDKARLFESLVELMRHTADGLGAIVTDDLQYIDTSSMETAGYLLARQAEGMELPRFMTGIRSHELAPEMEAQVQRLVDAGLAVRLHVEPLTAEEVVEMVRGLGPAFGDADALAPLLTRHTGGNPLFVVETLKSLMESGELSARLPERLPLSSRVEPVLSRRLKRLSLPALQLARLVAVAKDDFSPELAEEVLGVAPLDVAGYWQELLDGQFMRERWFTHDLLYEAVLREMPAPVRRWFHRRVAEALEARALPPSRIAPHWHEAGEVERAH